MDVVPMAQRFDLVIRAASALVDGEFRAAEIGVTGGRIDVISSVSGALDGERFIELADDEVLLPGLVDSHVHINEPGRTEWEGFASATRAAAAGGVTTVIDMPLNSIPATTTVDALSVKRAVAAQKSMVDVGFWGGAVPENLGTLKQLHDAGVFGFKAFLTPSGVDEFGHLDADQLEAALEELAAFGGLLIVHAEDPGVLDAHENAGGRHYADFVDSRPDQAEITAIERVIAGVRRTGGRAHILHLSSAAALPGLRAARAEGLRITVETCPHYLSFSAEEIADGATQFKCCPPIRDEDNRDALWQALLDGDIDVIVTDHSPSTAELKFAHDGDFALAWGGIAGLQLGLPAIWTEAQRRGIPLERVLGWMSAGPAALVGLSASRGGIHVGAHADLVAFAPDATFTVHATELQHKNAVSAFDGLELRGVVRGTWLRGDLVDISEYAAPTGELLVAPTAAPLRPRTGQRPSVSTDGPQTQLDQRSSPELWGHLVAAAFALPHVIEASSSVSPASSRALLFDDLRVVSLPESSLAPEGPLEPVHLHGIHDTSVHLVLPRDRAAEVIDAGWAEAHQYGDFGTEVLVYGPRDADELAVIIGVIRESLAFAREANAGGAS
jgi:allantoinase